MTCKVWFAVGALSLIFTPAIVGCGASAPENHTAKGDPRATSAVQVNVERPEVSADEGGRGFLKVASSGWQTADDFEPLGSTAATKGGAVRYWVGGFPNTVRTIGKDSDRVANRIVGELCYESLLERHQNTLEFIPRLATHWWVSEDKTTYRFRINPLASWADGNPVLAADVVATWDLLMDEKILDPAKQVIFGKFDRPKVLSPYLVEVRAKDASWRNFLSFATMAILPAHEIEKLDGEQFLQAYRFRPVTGSGPYSLRPQDVKQGHHVTLRRRDDYWGANEPFARGRFNFDSIRLVTTEEYNLGLEKAKKGEIDIFKIGRAKDWAVDLPRLEQVQRGLLLMRRVYNDEPQGTSGIVMNMRRPPLDDVRVRRALGYLFNRTKLIDKLFYSEYRPLDSYFPGGRYANPNNPRVRYDPDRAVKLLKEAGWGYRDPSDGVRVKNGRRLELEVLYSSKTVERYLSVFQEDCLKAGVHVDLKQLTRAARFQITFGNRKFHLTTEGWRGLVDPSPETNWFAGLADEKNNNNLAGFKNARVDELCRAYEQAHDLKDRVAIIHQIDALIFEQAPCVLGWTAGCNRLAFWNKYGYPDWCLGRVVGATSVLSTWWYDEAKARRLKEAKDNPSITLDRGPTEVRYWK